jgi:hypothetical protein
MDPIVWIETFEDYCADRGVDETEVFKKHLGSIARHWFEYEEVDKKTSWKEIKQAFLSYAAREDRRDALARSFEPNEEVQDYFIEKALLLNRQHPNMALEEKIRRIRDGLPFEMQEYIPYCATLGDLKKHIEDAHRKYKLKAQMSLRVMNIEKQPSEQDTKPSPSSVNQRTKLENLAELKAEINAISTELHGIQSNNQNNYRNENKPAHKPYSNQSTQFNRHQNQSRSFHNNSRTNQHPPQRNFNNNRPNRTSNHQQQNNNAKHPSNSNNYYHSNFNDRSNYPLNDRNLNNPGNSRYYSSNNDSYSNKQRSVDAQGRLLCFKCGEPNHLARACRQPKNYRQSS